jgi:RNA polymerase sigma-70 factor (ECF subfamily)
LADSLGTGKAMLRPGNVKLPKRPGQLLATSVPDAFEQPGDAANDGQPGAPPVNHPGPVAVRRVGFFPCPAPGVRATIQAYVDPTTGRPEVPRMETTPVTLLERLRRPDARAAWERFVRLYTPLLLRWAYRLGLSTQDAADLVQDVFVVLVQKLPEFRYDRQGCFRAWLRTVVLNKWRDRVARRAPRPLDQDDPALAALAVADDTELFGEAEYRHYLSRRALELIQEDFQPATWKAFWECVVADRPAAEVAAELHLTVNAVYLAKGRVLRRLRAELDGLLE